MMDARKPSTKHQAGVYCNSSTHYRDPPPYPGLSTTLYQPGYRQSYSGSEASTDLSLSSCENLCTSVRQEPQGEETNTIEPLIHDTQSGTMKVPASTVCTPVNTMYTPVSAVYSPANSIYGSTPVMGVASGSQGNSNNNNNNNNNNVGGVKAVIGRQTTMMSQYQTDAMRSLCQQMCSQQPQLCNQQPQGQSQAQQVPYLASPKSSPLLTKQQPETQLPAQHQQVVDSPVLRHPDTSPSLSQLMSALSRQSANQTMTSPMISVSAGLTRERQQQQRPSTAPTQRSLPQPHPGHVADSDQTCERMTSSSSMLRRSQPDLTQFAVPPSDQQQEGKASRPSDLRVGAGENGSASGDLPIVSDVANQGNGMTLCQQQVMSSQLAQLAQLQNCHVQANGAARISEDQQSRMERNSSPGSQSPSLRKLCDPDYAALTTTHSNQICEPVTSTVTRSVQVVDHAAIATRATQMVERLSEENRSLRQELEGYYKKVYRLQKLELEIQKVHENYETLVKHSHKQQSLEKMIRLKLEAEIKKLCEVNKELKEQLDKALRQLQQKETYTMLDSEMRKELLGKDSLIVRLISQNQDLTATKEQLEMEFASQKSVMHDQSMHLKLLDSALCSARSEVMRYEEQLENQKADEGKVMELQRALTQLQMAVEKREAIEQKLRQKLEEEVQYLRNQQAGINKMSEADEGISSDSESPTSVQSLLRQITEKEQRIITLEADVAKWKQKYLEETALRQFAVNAASMSKDARIASLEQSSLETEKLMAEARNDRIKQMDEVHIANRKCAELEAKLKTVQAQLAEKDAMIKLLQNHEPISRTPDIANIMCSHSLRSSISTSSPPSSPIIGNHSLTTSNATGRQNGQLEATTSGSNSGSGNGKNWEGKLPVHSKSNSTGSTACGSSSSTKDAQLRELQQKLAAQAVFFGHLQSGSEPLSNYLWQV